ncbi:MAG TPA: hypothetical protein VKY19_01990 [Ktedonosporobacter sp.]|nr:hypothetical protein [Ktedonosporobacter sp.]
MSSRCQPNRTPRSGKTVTPEQIVKVPAPVLDRRTLLKVAGSGAAALATVGSLAWMPKRVSAATNAAISDIQFDIGAFVHPAQAFTNTVLNTPVPFQFGVIFTFFAPAALTRNPTKADQVTLSNALATLEANFPFSPSGLFTFVSYGLPYFNRLPQSLVTAHMPTLRFDASRSVLEEAVPGPTDFGVPGISKLQSKFRVPVRIEHNDVLFTFRSDSLANIINALAWLQGSNLLNGNVVDSPDFNGLFSFGPTRFNFVQPGLPRQVADAAASQNIAPFPTIHTEINPASSMWMGFVDQQLDGSAPSGSIVTFAGTGPHSSGTGAAQLTSAVAGDYFDNGSIQHLSHVLDDLEQFYTKESAPRFPDGPEPFSERVQYMFHSRRQDGSHALPFPENTNDAFTNGGGQGNLDGTTQSLRNAALLPDFTLGPEAVFQNFDPAVTDHPKLRVGHEFALQRSSRAPDGTPLHIRNDGPGLSTLDVPDGSLTPTLEFTIFVPTSDFFQALRVNAASLDLVKEGQNGGTGTSVPPGVEAADSGDDGLERFLSATRRQNFLIPPRRHRSFPLLELT